MTSLRPRVSRPRAWLIAAMLVLALALATAFPAFSAAHLPAQHHTQLACGAVPMPC